MEKGRRTDKRIKSVLILFLYHKQTRSLVTQVLYSCWLSQVKETLCFSISTVHTNRYPPDGLVLQEGEMFGKLNGFQVIKQK